MPPGIGYSFQPGQQDIPLQGGDGGQTTTVPQQAIRTLSLRVPQTQSVPGLSPLPLLNATGGGGTDLDLLLTALLRAFRPQAFAGGQGGSFGPPRVRPIDEPPSGPLAPADLAAELRRRSGGRGGFGDTGRDPGPLGPAPPTIPPQDFPVPEGPLGPAPRPRTFDRVSPLF